jgi:hypothetical protein
MKKQIKIVLNLECDTDQSYSAIENAARDALAQFVHKGFAFAVVYNEATDKQDDIIIASYEVK